MVIVLLEQVYHKRLIAERQKRPIRALISLAFFKLRTQGFLVQRRDALTGLTQSAYPRLSPFAKSSPGRLARPIEQSCILVFGYLAFFGSHRRIAFRAFI